MFVIFLCCLKLIKSANDMMICTIFLECDPVKIEENKKVFNKVLNETINPKDPSQVNGPVWECYFDGDLLDRSRKSLIKRE